MLKNHDFCEKTGYGYISYLIKNFKIKKLNPAIINYRSSPPNYWLYLDTSKQINRDYKILLNYELVEKQVFQKHDDKFLSDEILYGLDFLERLEFIFDNKKYDLKNNIGTFQLFNVKESINTFYSSKLKF